MTAAWVECDCCDEFICNVHGNHVFECECPVIDVWCEAGLFPYDAEVTPELIKWVEAHPFEDDE